VGGRTVLPSVSKMEMVPSVTISRSKTFHPDLNHDLQ
tara:strand:+ start:910 stop:1020 length:111 start_codon:yes stop_codon:yes gene_type:complete